MKTTPRGTITILPKEEKMEYKRLMGRGKALAKKAVKKVSNLKELTDDKEYDGAKYIVHVMVLSKFTDVYMVGDTSGVTIPLVIDDKIKSLLMEMKIGNIYQLLGVHFNGTQLILKSGGFYILDSKKKWANLKPQSSNCTSNDVLNIRESNVEFDEKLIMKLESVDTTKVPEVSTQPYRRALFIDEFNKFYLTSFGYDTNRFDDLVVGELYELSNFKTNYYKNEATGTESMNGVYMTKKTKIVPIRDNPNQPEFNSDRVKKLLSLKNEIAGKVFQFFNKHEYPSCTNCKKSIAKAYQYERIKFNPITGTKSKVQNKCKCGIDIPDDPNALKINNYKVSIVLEVNNEYKIFVAFKDNFKEFLPLLGKKQTDEKLFEYLTNKDVVVTFNERSDQTGKVVHYIKTIKLVKKKRGAEEEPNEEENEAEAVLTVPDDLGASNKRKKRKQEEEEYEEEEDDDPTDESMYDEETD